MTSVRTVDLQQEVSRNDAVELSKDIRRMVRRARESKRSRMFVSRSVENLRSAIDRYRTTPSDDDFESRLKTVKDHRDEALQAIRPFTAFFYSNGLLPDEVNEDAHLLYILIEMEEIQAR